MRIDTAKSDDDAADSNVDQQQQEPDEVQWQTPGDVANHVTVMDGFAIIDSERLWDTISVRASHSVLRRLCSWGQDGVRAADRDGALWLAPDERVHGQSEVVRALELISRTGVWYLFGI